MNIEQIISAYSNEKVEIEEPTILIRVNKLFRYSMSYMELYDITRGVWRISFERAKKVKYAFSVYEGIIQEVYEVLHWYPAGSTLNIQNIPEDSALKERWEFIGNIAKKDIRDKYKYKSVEDYFERGSQNPITYVNC